MKVLQLCMNAVPTCVESEVLQRSNSRELLVYTIVTIGSVCIND